MAQAMSTKGGWDAWKAWQHGVVAAIRQDFGEVLTDIGEDDVDWDAWRPYFDLGHSPRSAVDEAFLRNHVA